MIKLSIEEKARAYDEALKVLHKYDGANIMFSQSLKEEMFPELKESDDERIRKSIIRLIQVGGYMSDEDKSKAFTWLEKQGEHDMGISEVTKQELKDNLNKALAVETGESWNEFLDEQKSAWSEEDLMPREEIINLLQKYGMDNEVAWLKSLRPQTTWKPSGEQMKFLWKYAEQNNYDGRILGTLYNDLKKLRGE